MTSKIGQECRGCVKLAKDTPDTTEGPLGTCPVCGKEAFQILVNGFPLLILR
jgi:rRNA maturation endonuclease Nob1